MLRFTSYLLSQVLSYSSWKKSHVSLQRLKFKDLHQEWLAHFLNSLFLSEKWLALYGLGKVVLITLVNSKKDSYRQQLLAFH